MTGSSSQNLYRQQAIDAQATKQYGQVLILPRVKHLVLFAGLTTWIIALGYFVSTQSIADTVQVRGWIDTQKPALSVRSQESAGVVAALYVTNDQRVKQGEAIALISRSKGEALGLDGRIQQQKNIEKEQTSQLGLIDLKEDALLKQIDSLKQQRVSSRSKAEQLARHANHQALLTDKLASQTKQIKALFERGIVTRNQLDQHQIQVLSLKQSSLDIELQSQDLIEQQVNLTTQVELAQADLSKLVKERELLTLSAQDKRQQLSHNSEYVIRSPSSGLIDNLQIAKGDSVGFQQELAQIQAIDNEFTVRLAVAAHQIANISQDQLVKVSVDGFAYQQFGFLEARVQRVSNKIMLPSDINRPGMQIQQPVYLLELELLDNTLPSVEKTINLRAGMTVSANVYTHEQSILAWLLEPVSKLLEQSFSSTNTIASLEMQNEQH